LENYAVYYYSDEQSAHNDLYNQNHFGSSYRNQIPNEIITAKVVDLNSGCYSLGKVKLVATPNIEMFPRYFTPNNDGINDTWKVTGIDEDNYEVSYILIFSRFGKQLAKISSDSEGWDGLYDGKKLPSSDYWFSAELVDPNGSVKIKKGHFSLIRR
jgi:gliding motility-associated-like protein